jgi:hypothetical protein
LKRGVPGESIMSMAPCVEVVHTWWQWHPPIGFCVAVLGVVGVLVPWLKGEGMGRRERAFWSAVMIGLTLVELWSIRRDQKERDAEQAFARCEEQHSFEGIVQGLTEGIQTSKDQYSSTITHVDGVLEKTQQVAATAQTNLDEVVGKGSHPCVVPDTLAMDPEGATIPLNIWNTGKNVLTGVDLFFEHFPPDVKGPVRGTASLTTIGTLSPGWPKPLPITPAQRSSDGTIYYRIQIHTQNGFYEETLQLRRSTKGTKVQPPWAFEYFLIKPTEIRGPTKRFPHMKGRGTVSLPMKDCWREWSDGGQ